MNKLVFWGILAMVLFIGILIGHLEIYIRSALIPWGLVLLIASPIATGLSLFYGIKRLGKQHNEKSRA